MEALFTNLAHGFSVALSFGNLGFCILGVLLGTLVGVLPGLGPVATIAILLPVTFNLDPTPALIMLAGIYYGAQYGGSISAILLKLPGEASSVVTILDGNAMARQGRAGEALAVSAIGSFFAGTLATLAVAMAAPLAELALLFRPADYFALMLLGLVLASVLAHGALPKGIAMTLLGVALGLIGTDVNSGEERFTFGIPELADGIGFVPLTMGLFGIADVAINLERGEARAQLRSTIHSLRISRETWRRALPAMFRGTLVGGFLGLLPGGGAILGSFAAYLFEKRIAKDPSRFGNGAVEGVAAPEAANNAGAQAAFIPMLTLGIPSNAVMALMIGALTIHGIVPGPQVVGNNSDLFWGLVVSMWIGNLALLVINLPLVGIWVRLLDLHYRFLFPAIVMFCCIGAYAVSGAAFDVGLTAFFGLVGYMLLKLGFEPAPLVLGFVLGPAMEEHLRRALLLSRGDAMTFLEHPVAATLLALAAIMLIVGFLPALKRVREQTGEDI